jgi:hypothetical protein
MSNAFKSLQFRAVRLFLVIFLRVRMSERTELIAAKTNIS